MIYSKRFLIKTMQLVGASKSFISYPFIRKMTLNGLIGALVAIALMSGGLFYLWKSQPEVAAMINLYAIGAIYLGMILMATGVTSLSTFIAMRRFLKMKIEDLYY